MSVYLSLSPVEKCMSSMQTGTQMVKLRGGSKGLVRFFYLDEHKSCIRWRPSRKNEKAKSESSVLAHTHTLVRTQIHVHSLWHNVLTKFQVKVFILLRIRVKFVSTCIAGLSFSPVSLSAITPVSLSAITPVSLSSIAPVSLSSITPVSLALCLTQT